MAVSAACADAPPPAETVAPRPMQATPPVPVDDAAFVAFWATFQAAIASGDAARVAALTAFPFTTRGPLGGDAPRSFDEAAFRTALPRILSVDAGLSATATPMQAHVVGTPVDGVRVRADEARLGAYLFKKTPSGWRFAHAFVDAP